jgi:hypothetical protein
MKIYKLSFNIQSQTERHIFIIMAQVMMPTVVIWLHRFQLIAEWQTEEVVE